MYTVPVSRSRQQIELFLNSACSITYTNKQVTFLLYTTTRKPNTIMVVTWNFTLNDAFAISNDYYMKWKLKRTLQKTYI